MASFVLLLLQNGMTTLMIASKWRQTDTVKILLAVPGIHDINMTDKVKKQVI